MAGRVPIRHEGVFLLHENAAIGASQNRAERVIALGARSFGDVEGVAEQVNIERFCDHFGDFRDSKGSKKLLF